MNVDATWAIAQKTAKRESVCGDAYVVAQANGRLLWSIVDGAGHGVRANRVAEDAADQIRTLAFAASLEDILTRIHHRLRGHRGAAVSLLRLDRGLSLVEFAGVGNVELRSCGPSRIRPATVPGILGRALRRVKTFSYEVTTGDFLVMFSDGISSRLSIKRYAHFHPDEAAGKIMEEHHKTIDDGTCIVIRLTGQTV